MTFSKPLLAGVAAVLVAGFILAANWYRSAESARATDTAAAGRERLIKAHSPTTGPADAPVTIVEFLDPECETCRAMHPIVKRVMSDFPGRVRLVIRYMPLHRNSAYAAVVLEASKAQDRYWELLDLMFERQPLWASHDRPRPELLMEYVAELGMDAERLRAATTNPDLRARVQEDRDDGVALGVTGTPTFFVNGTPVAQLGYGPLRAAVQGALP